MAVGFALGLLSTAFALALGDEDAFVYYGIVLAGIAWVYFGFAVADGRWTALAIQGIAALVFLNVAFLGARNESELLLGVGFLAHAGWDWFHHDGHGPTEVRTWYPPFCVVADVVIAVPLLV